MKRQIITWGMMLAAAFTLTNCAKEIENPTQEPESVGYPFEIVASTVDTKTVNDGMSTKWVADDQINLFHAVVETTEYINDGAFEVSDVEAGRFTGTLKEKLDSQEEYDWYAFYPYKSQIETPKNTTGWAYIGNKNGITQNGGYGNKAHIAATNCPLYGVATAVPAADMPAIEMQHLSSVIAINVTNNTDEDLVITNATFTANEPIVGSFYIDFSDIPTYTCSEEQYVSNAATVNVNGGAALGNGDFGILYLVVKPFTAAKDSKLYLSVNGHKKELTMTKDITFSAGKIKTLNFSYDKVKEVGVTTATISFASEAQRVSHSTTEQVWANDGITFTNTKANSTNDVVNNVSPVRLYKNSDIKIGAPGYITKIEFNSATGDYFTNLKNLLPNASVNGQIVTEVYDGSSSSVSYSLTTGQVRLNSITVTYSSEGYVAPTLESIAVDGEYKTEFTKGEDFSFGGVITATYSDESTKPIAENDCTFSGYDKDVVGNQTITVTYEGKTATYEINVKEAPIAGGEGGEEESGWVVTAFADLKAGDQVVIVGTKSSSTYAMSNDKGTNSAPIPVSVTVSNDKLTAEPANNIIWYVGVNGSNRVFNANEDGSTWLYCTNTNNGVRVGTNTAKTFTLANGYLKHEGTSRFLGIYNTQDWRCYTSHTATNIANQTFQFFVKKGGSTDSGETPKEPVELTMSEVTCIEKNANSLTFTWSDVEGATAYQVFFDGDDKGTITTTTYTVSDLEAGTEHTIAVKAVGDGIYYTDSEYDECSETTSVAEQPGESSSDPVIISVTFSEYTAGTQYAKNEEHKINDNLTIIVNDGHFTTQLRLYDSSSNNSTAWSSELPGYITNMEFNVGYKAAKLHVYGSVDGSEWSLVDTITTTTTSYKDYTVEFPDNSYKYFKLDADGNQLRIAKMSVTYVPAK